MPASFELFAPGNPDEAVAALRASAPGETVVLAGGTDLLGDLERDRVAPRRLLSLRRLPWKYLEWSDDSLAIGSTLPLRTLELDPGVRTRIPGLFEAIRAVGSVALRHRATLGGNIVRSSPASDLLPILLALDAEVDLVGPTGGRRAPLAELLARSRQPRLRPAELVRAVRLPEARPSTYLWQRIRPVNDISQVGVAVARSPRARSWRVVLGAVLPHAQRVPAAEGALGTEARPRPEAIDSAAVAAAEFAPFAGERRGSDEYRRQIVRVLVGRAVRSIAGIPEEGAA